MSEGSATPTDFGLAVAKIEQMEHNDSALSSDGRSDPDGKRMFRSRSSSQRKSAATTPTLAMSRMDTQNLKPTQGKDESPSPVKAEFSGSSTKNGAHTPQLITNLACAESEAMATFHELETSTYQNRNLGFPRQQEDYFQCECRFDAAIDPPHGACGEGSNCINRLTQVECPENDCQCREYCQNQRLAKRQYSTFEIVKTEKKGFGVRASTDLSADSLVIEYVGEVIGHNNFVKRIRDYSDEGIKHFYFMALQKDEFIDATKKGGRGRFLNHSCNPNCYVAKWVVGRRLRMGIFAKRRILRGEELTFNYNVDRYGHEAQECYCGEANCVGYIGGKTQTDIGIMDDLFLDALGIAEEVEQLGLKGSRKKKGKRLDEDFLPVMRPILIDEVPKVASALRQAASNKRILVKLLQRMQLTTEIPVHNQFMRLRGFSLMAMLLEEHARETQDIGIPILKILLIWPLITKNKLSLTNLEGVVQNTAERSDSEECRLLAETLLQSWSALELAYRIPRAQNDVIALDESAKRKLESIAENIYGYNKRQRLDAEDATQSYTHTAFIKPAATIIAAAAKVETSLRIPAGWAMTKRDDGEPYYYHIASRTTRWTLPTQAEADEFDAASKLPSRPIVDLASIIEQAKASITTKETAPDASETTRTQQLEPVASTSKTPDDHSDTTQSPAINRRTTKESKDKQILHLFSPIVVEVMNKYAKSHLDREQFKKRAKELAQLLVEKERKSPLYAEDEYATMSAEKSKKIRSFAKEWVAKLVKHRKGSSRTAMLQRSEADERTHVPNPEIKENAHGS